jgi:hypothetical protein
MFKKMYINQARAWAKATINFDMSVRSLEYVRASLTTGIFVKFHILNFH